MRVRGQKSAKDLEVEARCREHAKAGYPQLVDEQALRADEILKAVEEANKQRS